MNRKARNKESADEEFLYGMRKTTYWEKYGLKHFPYPGRRRYTPSFHQSFDGGIIISNDVFGLAISQFEQKFRACLEKRTKQEQWILNLRYPDKSSNEYLEYLQTCTDQSKYNLQSIESLNTVDEYQNKNSRNETNEMIHVVTMLRDEIKQNISENTRNMNSCENKIDEIQQTMSNISSENIRNTNSIDMKIQDLKGYFDTQMSNVNERVSHLTEGQAFPEIRQNIVNNNSQHPTGCGDNQYHHQSDKVHINGDSENSSRQNQPTYSYEQSTSHSHNSVNNSHFDPQIQYRNRQLHPKPIHQEKNSERTMQEIRQEIGGFRSELSTLFQEIKVLSKNNQNSGPQGENKWRNYQNNQSNSRSGQNNNRQGNYNNRQGNNNNRQGNYNNRQDNFQNNRSTFNDNRGNNFSSENQRIENNHGKLQSVELMGQRSTTIDGSKAIKIQPARVLAEGLFVLAGIFDKTINMMLDTGASVTILSKKFFETLDISLRKGIIPVKQKLVSATGDTADFLGKMKIKIHLGKNRYEHEVLIADIPSEGILGIDFLEQKMCDIILKEKCLRIDGENVPCFKNREPVSWVGRITLFEDLILPPSSETIVSGNILDPVIKGKTAIVEPSEHFTNTISLLLAKLVVNTSNSKIPLKNLNMNDHECVIYKDTVTAFIEPIAEIIEPDMCNVNKIVTNDETGTRSKNCDLPEHIRPVFESSIKELN
ncbi:unnamed protein product [Mytilus edulis]|uniref:Peptidase A2 domain-containing protein n=1 Tax=Mytilus edulis TaxID=6550 RepID=A0A8S3R6G9_MYTED|nr:unnamed protein product [Mytilus edulis]